VTGSGTNLISGNTLNDVSNTSTFYGIYVPGTGMSAITGNTLSQLSTSSTMYALYTSGSGAHTTTSTNTVSGINSGSTTYVIYATGTTPTRVISDNTIQDVNLSQTSTNTLAGMYITASGTNTVTGNTIQRLSQKSSSTTQTAALYGIYVTNGSWISALNNNIDSLVNRTCQGSTRGIYISGGSGARLSGNTISRLWSQNDETPPVMKQGSVGGMIANAGLDTLENNTVFSLHTAYDTTTTSTFTSAYGIDLASSSVNGIVRGNLIYNVVNHNAGTKKTYTSLLLIEGTGAGTVVEKNRMYGLVTMGTGVSTGTPPDNAPPIASAVEISGAANAIYTNNEISVGDEIGNEAIVIGFDDLSTGSSAYYYNSVYVGGANSSGASRSAAYAREGAGTSYATSTLTNNLFYNKRSGGTGGHYAVMNPGGSTGWSAADFNLLVSSSASTIGLWSTTDCNFAAWKTQSGGDTYSLSTDAASLTSTRLFTSPGTADLSIVTANPECWYVNGKGIAGAASGNVADDYGAASVRSTTLGFATDIGADEFNTSAIPPVATASGIPVANTTTYYSFAGQNLASITWGSGGTVPSVIEFRYYSGDNPPAPLTGNYSNAYANITQSSGTGCSYDITFGYSQAWLGTISSEANIRLAKRDGGIWSFLGTSAVNTTNKTVTQTGLTSFSDFTMSDATNPLPVELLAFNAQYRGTSVHLSWKTASELNTLRYEIQRRTVGDWEALGSVDARGSADTPFEYSYADSILPQADRYLYRLKMIDRDGSFEYSREVLVQALKPDGFRLFVNYPNPFNPSTTISFSLPSEQFVTIRVLDATGREVELLQSGMLPAGVHSSLFFARDLPSGVYTCVVTAGGEVRTGRIVLAR